MCVCVQVLNYRRGLRERGEGGRVAYSKTVEMVGQGSGVARELDYIPVLMAGPFHVGTVYKSVIKREREMGGGGMRAKNSTCW